MQHPIRRRRRRDDEPAAATPTDAASRADDTLRRARHRNAAVVTLDCATSPADSSATLVIPRHTVTAADPHQADPDSTQVIRVHGRSA